MFSYRYMHMNMNGNGEETNELSTSEILRSGSGDYMVAPESMPMEMHMLGMMYAVSDKVTLMAMLPYVNSSMDHVTASGGAFTTESSGPGDIKLSALYNFYRGPNNRMHWHFGISIPTGSVEEKDDTPMAQDALMPYPMQNGSGSWDFMPGLTYLVQNEKISAGMQGKAVVRLTDNDNDYRLGNRYTLSGWAGYKLSDYVSPLLSLEFNTWSDISGRDRRHDMALNNNIVHTVDPDKKAGSRLDLGLGLNISIPEGPLHDLRIAGNYNLPVYQYVDGPQMLTQGILTVGLQYTIH